MAKIYVDYYEFLEISPTASLEEIRTAYKKKLIEYHPDKQAYGTEEEKKNSIKNFEIAKDALNILTNEQSRKAYDLERKRRRNNLNNNKTSNMYNYGQEKNDFYKESDAFSNIFAEYFSEVFRGDYNHFNYGNTDNKKEYDFTEIMQLDEKIKEVRHERIIISKIIIELRILINNLMATKFDKLRIFKEEIRKKPEYVEAIKFLDKVSKRDSSVIIFKFFGKKIDEETILHYEKIKEIFEQQILEYEKSLDKEIDDLCQEKRKNEKKEFTLSKEESELKKKYDYHPLRYAYEKFKNEESKKKKAI